MELTPHFSLEELTRTDTGLPNVPNAEERANLARLAAELLEPLRAMAGCPLLVNSGYRSAAVNARVGGVPTSAHRDGRAADLRRAEGTCGELFERARRSGLPFDQIILEPLRAMAGCPLRINSGFRSAAVNAKVGGVPTSAHRDGRAADLRPAEGTCGELFERARRSGLPYDQLILEPTWIHVAIARDGQEPRRQALIAHCEGGRMRYQVA